MAINKSLIKIGSDFEMFLVNGDQKFISAIPFNNGTKSNPEELNRPGCCIQRDGVLQECNVPPVKLNEWKKFAENVDFVKKFITDTICKPRKLSLVCCASAQFEDNELIDPEATMFGCDPDFDAWRDGEINEKPHSDNPFLRSCGGHIHISYPDFDVDTSIELMKLFDLFLTVPFLLIDTDTERRKLYGKAGAFRLQNWGEEGGFEARTLSNVWIDNHENIEFVFNQLNSMIDYFNEKGTFYVNQDGPIIVEAINTNNATIANELCEKYKINLPTLLTV